LETTKKRADPGPQKSFVAQVETMPVLALQVNWYPESDMHPPTHGSAESYRV